MLSIFYIRKHHPRVLFLVATVVPLLLITILLLRFPDLKPIPGAFLGGEPSAPLLPPPDADTLTPQLSKTQGDKYTESTFSSGISVKPPKISNWNIDHDEKEDTSHSVSAPLITTVPETKVHSGSDEKFEWVFNTTRDERNYRLSAEQCGTAFPGLFNEIERAVAYRRTIGDITLSDIDISWKKDGVVRASIIDQQLYVLEAKFSDNVHESTRALAILHAMHRAIVTSPEPLPDIEFSFSTSDISDPHHIGRPIWALTRTPEQEEKWVMSDFGYWSWPLDLVGGYEQILREIANTEVEFAVKKKQAVWRGAVKTNELRKDLLRVTAGKDWADVQGIQWANASNLKVQVSVKALTMSEHCEYQFVIQTEGHSYSGRGKYLQNCNSVVIMHKRTWIEPHHTLLVASGPKQNFVEVENDFSDLEEKILELIAEPERARSIAMNGVETFRNRYLTPAAQACYWRKMVRGWAEVSFVPAAWDIEPESGMRRTRGIPFETFAIQAVTPNEPVCTWLGKALFRC